MVEKGSWVSVRKILLQPSQRTGKLPEETKEVPFIMWVKGTLAANAELGDTVEVTTRTGRTESGVLEAVDPVYDVNYGSYVPQLQHIGEQARAVLKEAGDK